MARTAKKHHVSKTSHRVKRPNLRVLVIALAAVAVLLVGWRLTHDNSAEVDSSVEEIANSVAISQAVDDASGVVVQRLNYDQASVDLKAKIVAVTKESTPACVKDEQLVDNTGKPVDKKTVYYASGGFAATTIGCDGGAQAILAKNSTGWQLVGRAQLEYKCADLRKYSVPLTFMQGLRADEDPDTEIRCLLDDNKTEVYR